MLFVVSIPPIAFAPAATAASQAAPTLTIPADFAEQFATMQQQGGKFDTSAAALGSPIAPTAADVERDFARLHWQLLPAPAVLTDPIVREWLAFVNNPSTRLSAPGFVQLGQPTTGSATPMPPGMPPAGPTPLVPGVAALGSVPRHHLRPELHLRARVQQYLIGCQATVAAWAGGSESTAEASWLCTAAVNADDEYEWFSSVTGNLITWWDDWLYKKAYGALVDFWNLPTINGTDWSSSTGGANGQRTVWWWAQFCSSTCGAVVLPIAWL